MFPRLTSCMHSPGRHKDGWILGNPKRESKESKMCVLLREAGRKGRYERGQSAKAGAMVVVGGDGGVCPPASETSNDDKQRASLGARNQEKKKQKRKKETGDKLSKSRNGGRAGGYTAAPKDPWKWRVCSRRITRGQREPGHAWRFGMTIAANLAWPTAPPIVITTTMEMELRGSAKELRLVP